MAQSKKVLDFETAQKKLEDILHRLSQEDISLDESVQLYAQAAELIAQCAQALKQAELKIQEVDASLDAALRENDAEKPQEGAGQ